MTIIIILASTVAKQPPYALTAVKMDSVNGPYMSPPLYYMQTRPQNAERRAIKKSKSIELNFKRYLESKNPPYFISLPQRNLCHCVKATQYKINEL